jgi:hypothetical protein
VRDDYDLEEAERQYVLFLDMSEKNHMANAGRITKYNKGSFEIEYYDRTTPMICIRL